MKNKDNLLKALSKLNLKNKSEVFNLIKHLDDDPEYRQAKYFSLASWIVENYKRNPSFNFIDIYQKAEFEKMPIDAFLFDGGMVEYMENAGVSDEMSTSIQDYLDSCFFGSATDKWICIDEDVNKAFRDMVLVPYSLKFVIERVDTLINYI